MHCVARLQRVCPAGGLDIALPDQRQHLTRFRLCRYRHAQTKLSKNRDDRDYRELFSHCKAQTAGSVRS